MVMSIPKDSGLWYLYHGTLLQHLRSDYIWSSSRWWMLPRLTGQSSLWTTGTWLQSHSPGGTERHVTHWEATWPETDSSFVMWNYLVYIKYCTHSLTTQTMTTKLYETHHGMTLCKKTDLQSLISQRIQLQTTLLKYCENSSSCYSYLTFNLTNAIAPSITSFISLPS